MARRAPNNQPLQGDQVCLVTGAARGIGRATAVALHAAGHRVVIADLDARAAETVADELGDRAWARRLDVADHHAFEELLDLVASRWDPVTVLVNNAGIMPLGPVTAEPDELTRAVLDINATAVITATKSLVSRLERIGSAGRVINVSSAAGHVPMPGAATYSASKHAVTGFSNALHLELRRTRSKVRVCAVHPGMVSTDIATGFTEARGPLAAVSPERVARTIVSLLDRPRANSYVPGFLALALAMQGATPPRLREWMNDLFGGEAALAAADTPARRQYRERVATDVADRRQGPR